MLCCDLAGSLQFGPNYNWIFRTFIIFRGRKNNFNINIDQLIHPFVMYIDLSAVFSWKHYLGSIYGK